MPPKLGILAGRGELPARLITACRAANRQVFVVAFNGETDPASVAGAEHAWVDVAAVGRTLAALRQAGCADVCLIGPIRRPNFSRLRPDWQGMRLLPRVAAAARRGDDAMMSVVVGYLEEEGFRVVGAEQVVEGLTIGRGPLGRERPAQADLDDIARGAEVVRAVGALDVGQAAVVRGGQVLAVEAAEGTDEMLERCRAFRSERPAGVLVKLPKPGQERRADLPTIGPPTVERVAAAGLRGIALEAGGALIVDRSAVIEAADARGLFVVGIEPEAER